MSAKVTSILDGVPNLLRKIQLADPLVRERTKAAIKRGTQRVAAGAHQRAPKHTGQMANTIRDEYSADGLVGYVKVGYGTLLRRSRSSSSAAIERHQQRLAARRERYASATTSRQAMANLDLGVYAPVVERGDPRRHHKRHPFLIPELVADRPSIIDDLKNAAIGAIRDSGVAE